MSDCTAIWMTGDAIPALTSLAPDMAVERIESAERAGHSFIGIPGPPSDTRTTFIRCAMVSAVSVADDDDYGD
jgi:hypothetical protein